MSTATPGIAVTPLLDIAYEHSGDPDGVPVVLLHGFPYDIRAYDRVAELLAARGASVYVPYLRGFGRTRFRDAATPRSGQQAAIAQDLLDFLDALSIDRAIVAGYDWGGRAACIVSALWPGRIRGLVSVDGYNVQNIAHAAEPTKPEHEATYWYQWYFQTERGRRGLDRNREELCELLWRMWSPLWKEAAAAFPASAPSLHNPDFVDVVIHSYRHRHTAAAGDPRYQELEEAIARQPTIPVPTVVIEGDADGVGGSGAQEDRQQFSGEYWYRLFEGIGHNTPQEAPEEFAEAVALLLGKG